MIKKYLSLHLHTSHSFRDAILPLKAYIDKAAEMNLPAVAVTNHGTMSDCYDLYLYAKEKNIKPIIGCEVYVAYDRLYKEKEVAHAYDHLVLLAKNDIGFQNLILIHNDSQINGFYHKPKTDIDFLRKHSEGIIACSACLGGDIAKSILKPKYKDQVLDRIRLYKGIFDDFYLEIQPGNFVEQVLVNNKLIELEEKYGFKTIITNDVHYLNKEDYRAHDIHVCSGRHITASLDKLIYPDKCYYVMTNEDLYDSLRYLHPNSINRYIDNIYEIIDKIEDYNIVPSDIYMPKAEVPEGYTEDSWLSELSFSYLKEKNLDNEEYIKRLNYELDTIRELKFSGYFLTVYDYVNWARNNGIQVGPGRGSVCGSLLAYAIGITKVDPIKYGLLFERFISVHRKGSVPDIDMDFQSSRRQEMFSYVVSKYGKDKCCLVSTFALRHSKQALRDVGKVFEIDEEVIDRAAKLVPSVFYTDDEDGNEEKVTDISIEDAIKLVPELEQLSLMYPEWFSVASKLTDIEKSSSVHAAGTIISPVSLTDKIPLVNSKTDMLATALNLKAVENGAKMIKFDFLGLSTLDIIDKVLKQIGKKNTDFIPDSYDDPKVWNLIASKNTIGLFQIGTPTYRQRMRRLAPKTIKELAACLALVRGPCIASKLDEQYMNILEGKEEVELIHPLYDAVTEKTNGILIYQEQLMKLCVAIGFTLEDGYRIMKHSAKKHFDELKEYKVQFMSLAKEKNISEKVAERLFKMIVDSGLYSFNESHAIAYAILTYISAYLKVYHEKEFICAMLTNAFEKKQKDKIKEAVSECRRLGYRFIAPDINKSLWDFTIENNKDLRIGFSAIKSFGEKAYNELIKYRPYTSMSDVYSKVSKSIFGKTAFIPNIFTGAFNCFFKNKMDAYLEYCLLAEMVPEDTIYISADKSRIPMNSEDSFIEEKFYGIELTTKAENALEYIDIDKQKEYFTLPAFLSNKKKIKDKNGKDMAFVELNTGAGLIETILFSSYYESVNKKLKKNKLLNVKIKKYNNSLLMIGIEDII